MKRIATIIIMLAATAAAHAQETKLAGMKAENVSYEKNGDYMAHVAFADGHVEKIPLRGGLSAIQELTTILCVGHGYTLKSDGYEKAE